MKEGGTQKICDEHKEGLGPFPAEHKILFSAASLFENARVIQIRWEQSRIDR